MSPGKLSRLLLPAASLFIYRPWCHIFCPFGLAGWVAEKISVYRVRVDCGKCVACGDCLAACPSGAVAFSAVRRQLPPPGKFKKS
ncbi:MAG: hypothetical protein ACYC2I_03585 [Elusimicrobiales bacterium]